MRGPHILATVQYAIAIGTPSKATRNKYDVHPNQRAFTNGSKRSSTAGPNRISRARCTLLKLPLPSAGSGAFLMAGELVRRTLPPGASAGSVCTGFDGRFKPGTSSRNASARWSRPVEDELIACVGIFEGDGTTPTGLLDRVPSSLSLSFTTALGANDSFASLTFLESKSSASFFVCDSFSTASSAKARMSVASIVVQERFYWARTYRLHSCLSAGLTRGWALHLCRRRLWL